MRDRIADILYDELDIQSQLNYDTDLDVEVLIECTNPIDKTEASVIIVSLASGSYANKNQGGVDGTYTYNIDVFTNSKTTESTAGDKNAALKLQRLLGLCRAILEDPVYRTLGFAAPFISRVNCVDIKIADTGRDDAVNTAMGRLTFNVVLNESSKLLIPNLIEGYDTVVKLGETANGYSYSGENY